MKNTCIRLTSHNEHVYLTVLYAKQFHIHIKRVVSNDPKAELNLFCDLPVV